MQRYRRNQWKKSQGHDFRAGEEREEQQLDRMRREGEGEDWDWEGGEQEGGEDWADWEEREQEEGNNWEGRAEEEEEQKEGENREEGEGEYSQEDREAVLLFLITAKPSMEHLIDAFMDSGCINYDCLLRLSSWSTDRVHKYLGAITQNGKPLTGMEKEIIKSHIEDSFLV